MPNEIFVTIEDAEGNNLTEGASSKESIGSYYKEEHMDKIFAQGLEQKSVLPIDRRNGQVTGVRRHEYLEVTKLIDKSSPILAQLMSQPTDLNIHVEYFRSPDETSAGEPVRYYQIKMAEAKLISIETVSPNAMDPANDHYMALEKLQFSFNAIAWKHDVCGTECVDSAANGENADLVAFDD